jgi:hypothetical protein
MKISKARKEQLRKMRQKHGLGEYSKNKKVAHMARRKGFFRRASGRIRKYGKRYGSGSINLWGAVKGVAFYGLYRAFLGSMIDGFLGSMSSIAEFAFSGLFLIKKSGWMRWLGFGMLFTSGYKLFLAYVMPFISGITGSLGLGSLFGSSNGNGTLIG